jgi:hypothetical protein
LKAIEQPNKSEAGHSPEKRARTVIPGKIFLHRLRQRSQLLGAPVFAVDGMITSVTISALTFDSSPGAAARGIAGSTPRAVLADSMVRDSYFLAGLSECIDVVMQATRIEHNSFGLNGALGQTHRHIHSVSAGVAFETNDNWIVGNHFSSARGGESVFFENGGKLHIFGNDFQGNAADTTLRIYGMFQVVIDGKIASADRFCLQPRF